jgi:DNA helicase-2/ATP-dependent DNA helicase PcrA
MTMRKAKGLEADVVVIAGLEDDLMPNPKSDITEESRLFYVSMTRAKEKLYLLHSFKRLRSISYGPEITSKKRSRFLDSIGRKSKYLKDEARTS